MNDLVRQLKAWRGRERLVRLHWGAARLLAIVAVVFAVCCFIDWKIDRRRDTPFGLRVGMLIGQAVLAGTLVWALLVRLRVPSLDVLAGKAEEELPEFDHRLVTALQLNRSGADLRGVSGPLLAEVTEEAVKLTSRRRLVSLVDLRPLEWAAAVFLPVAIALGALAAWKWEIVKVLVQRQFLADLEIPRSVYLQPLSNRIQPAGEPVRLLFAVRGEFRKDSIGEVEIESDGLPPATEKLTYVSGEPGKEGLFAAEVKAAGSFTYRAYLEDGRMKSSSAVEFVPRPAVKELAAQQILPSYVDPEGKIRYRRPQPSGDILLLPDSGLEVSCLMNKPVSEAWFVLLVKSEKDEKVLSRKAMSLDAPERASYRLENVPSAANAYRIDLVDEHQFSNSVVMQKSIGRSPYKAPAVRLLPELLIDPFPGRNRGPLEDYSVDGIPVTLDGPMLIGFEAKSPLGIRSVEVWYRVNASGDANTRWIPLELPLEKRDPKKGEFRPELGLFVNSGVYGSVGFYPIPSPDPAREPPGLHAGGRFVFKTGEIRKTDSAGNESKLAVGDQVEFLVVAYDRRPGDTAPGMSVARRKAVVDSKGMENWISDHARCQERLKDLFSKQKRVFQGSEPPKP